MKRIRTNLYTALVFTWIVLLVIISYSTSGAFTFTPDISKTDGVKKNTEAIKIEGDASTGFSGITYQVTSTGATSGTTYRTSAIYVVVEGYIFTVDSTQLMQTVPPGGQSITSQVTINRDQLLSGLNLPSDPALRERIQESIKDPNNISIRADIEIMQNGQVADKINGGLSPENRHAEYQRIAGKYGFAQRHMDDWETRFKNADQPTGIIGPPTTLPPDDDDGPGPDNTDNPGNSDDPPPSGGLRPSVIVR